MAARLALIVMCALLAVAPGVAVAATPAELVATYLAQRDDAVATARTAITTAGPGTPRALTAAGDARARIDLLGDALRATAGDGARGPVAARLAADARVADALDDLAAGDIDIDALDTAVATADAGYARQAADAAAGDGGLGGLDMLQAVGGPTLLVGLVAFMSWRATRRRREAEPTVARRRSRLTR